MTSEQSGRPHFDPRSRSIESTEHRGLKYQAPNPDCVGEETDPLADSQRLLASVRREAGTAASRHALGTWDQSDLTGLSEAERRATWLNVYNAVAQLELQSAPERLRGALRRFLFFVRDRVTIAGRTVSLNDIEHGYLRGRASWGLGYVPRLFAGSFERAVRVPLDPRIHFALNCGATSCPPIETYSAKVDRELDRATEAYLESTVVYDPVEEEVRVSKLFSWYRGDFGGTAGIRAFLRRYDCVPPQRNPAIRYRTYDWSPSLRAFASTRAQGPTGGQSNEDE